MKKFFNFWKQNWEIIMGTTLMVVLALLMPMLIGAEDPFVNARIWYICIFVGYMIIGGVLVSNLDTSNPSRFLVKIINVLLVINIVSLVLLFYFYCAHFFDSFPLIIEEVLSKYWVGTLSFIVLGIATFGGYVTLWEAKDPKSSTH